MDPIYTDNAMADRNRVAMDRTPEFWDRMASLVAGRNMPDLFATFGDACQYDEGQTVRVYLTLDEAAVVTHLATLAGI